MSYLLSNPSTKLLQALSKESWSRILGLARFYGWQPMGTLPPFIHNLHKPAYEDPAHRSWDGTYLRNEGQLVQATDALAMAIARQLRLPPPSRTRIRPSSRCSTNWNPLAT